MSTLHQLFIVIESKSVLLRAGWQKRILFNQYHYTLFQINYVFPILLFYCKHGVGPKLRVSLDTQSYTYQCQLPCWHPPIDWELPSIKESWSQANKTNDLNLHVLNSDIVGLDSGPLLTPEPHHRTKQSWFLLYS